jgi:hypothetical protein
MELPHVVVDSGFPGNLISPFVLVDLIPVLAGLDCRLTVEAREFPYLSDRERSPLVGLPALDGAEIT